MGRAFLAAANLAILAAYVVGSGWWVRAGDAWYRSLERPAWQPPDIVFGLIWPYNFAMLGIVGTVVVLQTAAIPRVLWLGCFALSAVAALAWANLFYVQHQSPAAAGALAAAALLTVPMVVVAFQVDRWAGVATVPYLVWLFLATSLAVGYALANPRG